MKGKPHLKGYYLQYFKKYLKYILHICSKSNEKTLRPTKKILYYRMMFMVRSGIMPLKTLEPKRNLSIILSYFPTKTLVTLPNLMNKKRNKEGTNNDFTLAG